MRVAIITGLALAAGTFIATPAICADQKTVVTFENPVEVPGQVLQPGTYVFKVADQQPNRNVVQVYSKDEDHLYGTFLTIPDYRLPAARVNLIVAFAERSEGQPEAVWVWLLPGEDYGREFVYPKSRAVGLAKANHQPVASMPDGIAGDASGTHVKAVTPNGEEVEPSAVFGSPEPDRPDLEVASLIVWRG